MLLLDCESLRYGEWGAWMTDDKVSGIKVHIFPLFWGRRSTIIRYLTCQTSSDKNHINKFISFLKSGASSCDRILLTFVIKKRKIYIFDMDKNEKKHRHQKLHYKNIFNYYPIYIVYLKTSVICYTFIVYWQVFLHRSYHLTSRYHTRSKYAWGECLTNRHRFNGCHFI